MAGPSEPASLERPLDWLLLDPARVVRRELPVSAGSLGLAELVANGRRRVVLD